jgi:hypothetical protein
VIRRRPREAAASIRPSVLLPVPDIRRKLPSVRCCLDAGLPGNISYQFGPSHASTPPSAYVRLALLDQTFQIQSIQPIKFLTTEGLLTRCPLIPGSLTSTRSPATQRCRAPESHRSHSTISTSHYWTWKLASTCSTCQIERFKRWPCSRLRTESVHRTSQASRAACCKRAAAPLCVCVVLVCVCLCELLSLATLLPTSPILQDSFISACQSARERRYSAPTLIVNSTNVKAQAIQVGLFFCFQLLLSRRTRHACLQSPPSPSSPAAATRTSQHSDHYPITRSSFRPITLEAKAPSLPFPPSTCGTASLHCPPSSLAPIGLHY